MSQPAIKNIPKWIQEHSADFEPPVANKMMCVSWSGSRYLMPMLFRKVQRRAAEGDVRRRAQHPRGLPHRGWRGGWSKEQSIVYTCANTSSSSIRARGMLRL